MDADAGCAFDYLRAALEREEAVASRNAELDDGRRSVIRVCGRMEHT
jgi:hypothetical protein